MATLPVDMAGSDEQVDTIQIETADYTDYELLSAGIYTSPSRVVKAETRTSDKAGKFVMARIEISELLSTDAENPQTFFLRKPLVKYIFSFKRKQRGHQGETSDIAKYLRAIGIELGGDVNTETLKNALGESAAYPVKLKVDWTNRTPKVGDDYLPEVAYTSDFRRGENGSAVFVPTITQEDLPTLSEKRQLALAPVFVGGKIQAKHKVGEFYKV